METTPAPDPATPPPPPAPRKRSRLRLVLLIAGGVLVALIGAVLIFAPPIIASTIRSQFVSNVQARMDATASLGNVTFSWFSGATLHDVSIKDRQGATIAAVKEMRADVKLLPVLGRRVIADVRVDGPRLELRRGPDGRLNVLSAQKPAPAEPAKKKPSEPVELPYLEVRLIVNDASILIAGEKENTEFSASGTFTLIHDKGRYTSTGHTDIRNGSIDFKAEASPKDLTKGDLTIKALPLDARMAPVLEILHPAFSLASGRLDGTMDGAVSLNHSGDLNEFPDHLGGAGRIEIRDCTFAGSNLLGDLLKAIGADRREIRLKPLEFRIDKGRLVYDKPWQWTISGSETTFSGSIGLDRTLDLEWHVPVTDDLANRVPALKSSRGKTYEVKIGGTVSNPRVDWKSAISQAAGDRIEQEAGKAIEGLLGGKEEKKAQKLLEEADQLYQEGKIAEAAAKYRELKDKYRKTRVYKDNKDRIDPRVEAK